MIVKLCRNCKYSKEKIHELRCLNPDVNNNDAWALANIGTIPGTSCIMERDRGWFSVCGMKGKKWEAKDE